jgi:hypothetical protein
MVISRYHHGLDLPTSAAPWHIWADHTTSTAAFPGALGPARCVKKTCLHQEHARSLRVLEQIDSVATTKD